MQILSKKLLKLGHPTRLAVPRFLFSEQSKPEPNQSEPPKN